MATGYSYRDSLRYAWHGSGRKWDAAWLQLIGGAIGGLIIWLLGLKVPAAILDNPGLGGVVAIILGAIVGAIVVFVARLCWWPFHWRLAAYGGLRLFLGPQMWPIFLMFGGIIAFATFFGGGIVWLALQMRDGKNTSIETPNTVGNPDFVILPPEGRYKLTWPGATMMSFDLRLDSQKNPDFQNNAAFILRNKTNTVAYRVLSTWKSETSLNIQDEIHKSDKLSKAIFTINDTSIIIVSTPIFSPRANTIYYIDEAPTQTVAVIAKEDELYFPPQIWSMAAIYLISRMPDKIGETSAPFVARVSLNWETAEGKRQRAYRVKISATNAKASTAEIPIVEAFLNFSVEEITQ